MVALYKKAESQHCFWRVIVGTLMNISYEEVFAVAVGIRRAARPNETRGATLSLAVEVRVH